jgi:TetR/AcrR family fatty acid metabolism transcriptional regulator
MSPKDQIKASAVILFAEKGFFNTSAAEIAQEAQVSLSTLYSFFADEAEIMKDIFTSEWQKRHSFYVNIKNWHMDWFLKINGILNFHLQEMQKEPELANVILTEQINPRFRNQEPIDKFPQLASIIGEILQKAIEENKIRSCNVEATSLVIYGFIDTLIYEYILTKDLKKLEQTIDNFCLLLKNGLEIKSVTTD